ncbi:MAG: DUF1501 domain-containing protein [Akkermansiaceae bacterium]|nr:DUF1501 domain-containing protein [Akkermansiaceae bacterium]MCP5550190.1 DUF1501 domain-containing protein [Akkermansiaceae bacterium]
MNSSPENLSAAGRDLLDRRRFLNRSVTGLGSIALARLLGRDALLAKEGSTPFRPRIDPARPYAARDTHFPALAKNVLVIFCSGAVSHVDTWDHKPELVRRHDTPMPGDAKVVTFQGEQGNLIKPKYPFKPRGQSGKMLGDLLPNLAELADDICFIHSLTSKTNTHGPGENFMSTGQTLEGFPSLGAWTTYALGSENDSLPAFVAIPDPRGLPQAAGNNWASAFLPAQFQGTAFNAQQPVRYLSRPASIAKNADRDTADFLKRLNARHLERFPGDSELAARIASYELAARMQLSVPELTDLGGEPAHILRAYGADDTQNPVRAGYAKNCILARRLIERGVRCVQLFNGAYAMGEGVGNWDGHKTIYDQYPGHAHILDQPTAALIKDLKQRGLLEDTLVVWCSEFGRMPTFQKGASGRDHNPAGFTGWLAGAGVKAPFSHGATDEFGWKAAEDISSVYEFHATILHLLGLDHERLTYYHNGLERRLTDVHGRVIREVLA